MLFGIFILFLLVLAAGNTHRFLPLSMDECQEDLSHLDHIHDLPMFHCLGHNDFIVNPGGTGFDFIGQWEHIHPWMTKDWHLQKGFTTKQTETLLKKGPLNP